MSKKLTVLFCALCISGSCAMSPQLHAKLRIQQDKIPSALIKELTKTFQGMSNKEKTDLSNALSRIAKKAKKNT